MKCSIGYVKAAVLILEEHGGEGGEPDQEVEDDAGVAVVGAVVVRSDSGACHLM